MPLLPSRALTNTAAEHLADHNQIHPKLNAVIDVKNDFGAVGDGTADDTAAVQAALDAASGTHLHFPQGTYRVTNLTKPAGAGPLHVEGVGPELSVIKAASGATGTLLDLTYASAVAGVRVEGLSFTMQDAVNTMIGLRMARCNRSSVYNCNFRYGGIGIEYDMLAGTGPFDFELCNFQNVKSEAIHLTCSAGTGNGTSGTIRACIVQITDAGVSPISAGVLIDYYTVGTAFDSVQVLAQPGSGRAITNGIVYNTSAPGGVQGAFLYFNKCFVDATSGHGLVLTNARGVQSAGNFWGADSGGAYDGVAITAGRDHQFTGDWISGRGMSFTTAPDKVVVGSGCEFPQTVAGGALVMPGSSPPTNLRIADDVYFYSSITNDVAKLEAATNRGYSWGRAGAHT